MLLPAGAVVAAAEIVWTFPIVCRLPNFRTETACLSGNALRSNGWANVLDRTVVYERDLPRWLVVIEIALSEAFNLRMT